MKHGFYIGITAAIRAGVVDWENDDIRIALMEGDKPVKSVPLRNRALTEHSTLRADDPSFRRVPDGHVIDGALIYRRKPNGSTDPLLGISNEYAPDGYAGTLPVVSNGGDINLQFHSGGVGSILL